MNLPESPSDLTNILGQQSKRGGEREPIVDVESIGMINYESGIS